MQAYVVFQQVHHHLQRRSGQETRGDGWGKLAASTPSQRRFRGFYRRVCRANGPSVLCPTVPSLETLRLDRRCGRMVAGQVLREALTGVPSIRTFQEQAGSGGGGC